MNKLIICNDYVRKHFNRLTLFTIQMRYNFNFLICVLLKQVFCFHAFILNFLIAEFHFTVFQAICLYYIIINISFVLCLYLVSSSRCSGLSAKVKASLSSPILLFDIAKEEVCCLFDLEVELCLNSFHLIISFGKLVNFKLFILTA